MNNLLFDMRAPHIRILDKVSEVDIFQFYLGCLPYKKKIKSILRNDDDTPSLILYSPKPGIIRYKDFGHSSGSAFELVKQLYNTDYVTACKIIDRDMQLGLFTYVDKPIFYSKKEIPKTLFNDKKLRIKIKSIDFNKKDLEWWNSYGITLFTLQKFNVKKASHLFVGYEELYCYPCKEITYTYRIGSRYKIYKPFTKDKENKFYPSNTNENSIQGYTQVDFDKKTLIITTSLKEIMCLYELGYTAIAPNAESVIINEKFIKEYKKYFKLIILGDWDEPGVNYAKKQSEIYQCDYYTFDVITHNNKKIKDLSDYAQAFGINQLKKLLNDNVDNN